MKKILIFLDELYYPNNNNYVSTYTAGNFFKDFNTTISFMFPVDKEISVVNRAYSTKIENHEIYELSKWTSVISFFNYYFHTSNNRKKLSKIYQDSLIDNEIVFIRMPSYPGILLAKQALADNKKVILHFAGDISEAWKHNKYNGVKKILAFMISKFMEYEEIKLSKNQNIYSLCTGNLLLDKFSKYGNSQFFIDSLIKKEDLSSHQFSIIKKRFIYIGRFTEDKGILLLLDVMNKLSLNYSDFILDVIGFGPEEQKVIEQCNTINNVNFIGFVPNNEIKNYLRNNDIFIMPSTLSEGFPRVILEAWAEGLAVLSSNVGGIEGLGMDGKNILFFKKNSFDDLYTKCQLIMENKVDLNSMQNFIVNNRDNITFEYYREILNNLIEDI